MEQCYTVPGGIEVDATGRLRAVSEAGVRNFPWRHPFFPVIFELDTTRLTASPTAD